MLIEQKLNSSAKHKAEFCQTGNDHQYWPDDDRMGWNEYLAIVALSPHHRAAVERRRRGSNQSSSDRNSVSPLAITEARTNCSLGTSPR